MRSGHEITTSVNRAKVTSLLATRAHGRYSFGWHLRTATRTARSWSEDTGPKYPRHPTGAERRQFESGTLRWDCAAPPRAILHDP
jgi:hypothetical protein